MSASPDIRRNMTCILLARVQTLVLYLHRFPGLEVVLVSFVLFVEVNYSLPLKRF
jgi:hypothetical protein